jgi:hypothetical protein
VPHNVQGLLTTVNQYDLLRPDSEPTRGRQPVGNRRAQPWVSPGMLSGKLRAKPVQRVSGNGAPTANRKQRWIRTADPRLGYGARRGRRVLALGWRDGRPSRDFGPTSHEGAGGRP